MTPVAPTDPILHAGDAAMTPSRRRFLAALAALPAAGVLDSPGRANQRAVKPRPDIATNVYPWMTFFQREGKKWDDDLDASLAAVVRAGFTGFEGMGASPEQVKMLAGKLKKHGLAMDSLYVNSTLHDRTAAERSLAEVLAIAEAARPAGCRILVTNPNPITWGGAENKDDAQLAVQAAALDRLGAELGKRGQTLAYHNHDIELRQAAREFHHMMLGTDPKNVSLCLDAHWVYRGSGDSQVALFDVVKLYGRRIAELHLRQSEKGVWTEAFGPGDIDYPRLAAELKKAGVRPLVVLEQAVEAKSPKTMNAVEAHKKGIDYATPLFFGDVAG